MKILIAGASGFIGRYLVNYWRGNHEIYALGRDPQKILKQFKTGVHAYTWTSLSELNPDDFDVVVNLAGETINHWRWSLLIKQKIINSRLDAVSKLADWCCQSKTKKLHFLSTSALSIYGLFKEIPKPIPTEHTKIIPHQEFLFAVAQKWEQATDRIAEAGLPLTLMRFAIVLAKDEGALPKLVLPAKLGLAARIGSGQQPFAWISITDLVRAIDLIITTPLFGVVNMVAPELPTQWQFTQKLAQGLKRPCFMFFPSSFLRLILGDMGKEMLLSGLSAYPEKLLTAGFQFNNPDVQSALKNLGVSKA